MNKLSVFIVITIAFIFSKEMSFSESNLWKNVIISRALDNQTLLDKEGKVLKIDGIRGLDLDFPMRQERPYARRVFQILKTLTENQTVRILPATKRDYKSKPLSRHIKIKQNDKWILLSEWLIENGYAYYFQNMFNPSINKSLQKAELTARQNKLGIWGASSFQESISKLRESASVMTLGFKKKYGSLSAPISVGTVKRVLSGSEIELENGAHVKLLGLQVPSFEDPRKAYSCFGENAKKYLESLVLGREVWLERDIKDTDERRRFLRYIKIPGDPNYLHSEIHVNKQMIESGYAKSYWPDEVDKKFKNEFERIQPIVYETMNGAWKYCLAEIVNPKKEEKVLVYDETCRIKGNISSGKYTYHTPESGWYKRIKPERCFENEMAADAAGFVKVK
jgi:endonuclease YncB( thermonuclease family)